MQGHRQWLSSGNRSARTRAQDRPRTGQGSRWTHLPEVRTHGLALDIDLPVQRRTATRGRTGGKRLCRCRESDDIAGSLAPTLRVAVEMLRPCQRGSDISFLRGTALNNSTDHYVDPRECIISVLKRA